ncbi:ABC transporter permease [Streptomyces sp. ISL-99]|uniref:ABC transporter permease n=1 Tax=Streptomyces sp. ISL-99 TaxID=2819193 RepID=UPI001BEC13EB|nr:ABC transporter permease [Streptomyces sp. ISL-99]MBT2526125.1 ABC transporter permease [Streptomyces sp. ISL-99]
MSALALRGPVWVTVRRHRRPLWAALALVVLSAATVIGLRVWTASRQAKCPDGDLTACGDDIFQYSDAHRTSLWAMEYGATGMLVIALLVAAFVAGPMVARDLESGAYRMLWTQSATPGAWLMARIVVPAVVVAAGVSALAGVYRWSWTYLAEGEGGFSALSWHDPFTYGAIGPASAAYALLAVAVGALAGLLVRRTVAAMAVAGLTTGAVALLMAGAVREHLWPVQTVTGVRATEALTSSWVTVDGMLTASGERLDWEPCYSPARADLEPAKCMAERGGVTNFADIHPSSHFWPLQLVETGIVLGVAALVTVAAFFVLRRRHA